MQAKYHRIINSKVSINIIFLNPVYFFLGKIFNKNNVASNFNQNYYRDNSAFYISVYFELLELCSSSLIRGD